MARLTAAERKKIPLSDFCFPDRAPDPGSYPIRTIEEARAALRLVGMHGSAHEKAVVRRKVKAKFPGIDQGGK